MKTVPPAQPKLYIGIDIHKLSWKFHFATDLFCGKSFSIPPEAKALYDYVQKNFKDPRIVLVNRSAEDMKDVLAEHGVNKVDAILSSLPLAVIPDEIKDKILDSAFLVLQDGGKYIQYQYTLNAKKLLEKRFGKLKMSFASLNIPPAFIYTGEK